MPGSRPRPRLAGDGSRGGQELEYRLLALGQRLPRLRRLDVGAVLLAREVRRRARFLRIIDVTWPHLDGLVPDTQRAPPRRDQVLRPFAGHALAGADVH